VLPELLGQRRKAILHSDVLGLRQLEKVIVVLLSFLLCNQKLLGRISAPGAGGNRALSRISDELAHLPAPVLPPEHQP
jgi:hypothetical protein